MKHIPKFKPGDRVVWTSNTTGKEHPGKIISIDEANPGTYLFLGDAWEDPDNINESGMRKENMKIEKDIWVNGNYYELYPEKVLGTPKKLNSKGNPYTDMHGKEITKYEGSFDLLERLDLPELDIIPTEAPAPAIIDQSEPEAKETDELLLEKSKEEIVTAIKQRKVKKVSIETSGKHDAELLTAREIFEKYNPKISKDELESFLWYQYVNGDMWEGLFQKMFDPSSLSESERTAHIKDWIDKGVLFYMNGELLPKVVYLSDNVYLRKQYLENDKKTIIEKYGEKVYQDQAEEIDRIFKQVYNKRLMLDADEDKRLKFSPTHELARIIKIETLDDEKPFVGTAFRDNQANVKKKVVGRIDFSKDTGYESWHMKKYESLNLTDAFVYWMKMNKNTINFKRGTSWEEIYYYYINNKQRTKDVDKEEFNKIKSRSRAEGDRLFSYFLANHIKANDKIKIETIFNKKLNSYISPDYEKIPVAFTAGKFYPGNKQIEIRPEKRSNVAFMVAQGSGLIPDGVGFGKTWSGIMAMAQKIEIGHAKRPVMVVPNQTYKQWLSETKGILPHVKINDLYNLSESYLNELLDADNKIKELPENSITFLTYEGMERIGFRGANDLYGHFEGHTSNSKIYETSAYKLYEELFEILQQGTIADAKEANTLRQKVLYMLGYANKNTVIDIEDLGFDFIGFDEAHALKKIFTRVVSNDEDKESKYAISSGSPSATAIKGFGLSHYILKNNKQRNVMLLTATPITNSPLEVYSILSLIAYKQMSEGFVFDDNVKKKLNNVVNFFDNFAEVTNDFVFTATMKFERRDIFIGWKNLSSLQRLLYRYSNYKKPESVPIVRPDKIEIPMPEGTENRINSILPLTPLQEFIMKNVVMYAEGTISYDQLRSIDFMPEEKKEKFQAMIDVNGTLLPEVDDEEVSENTEGETVNENSLSKDEKRGVILLRSVNMNRSIALSPYLLRLEDENEVLKYALGRPTYKEYIETSAKLKFTMDMVKMFKEYYESKNEPVSGQLIYMDRGKEFFPLVKEYLIKEIGFKEHEIGMIYSGMKSPKGVSSKDAKQYVQNKFLGIDYDKDTGVIVNIPDEERMKILIGSSSMREGMNLQKHSIVLYDLFPAWNPTDRIQLLGRIHRQGNKHRYCFAVTPLMINSIDIFMMQKLQEKTQRINAIWDIDGQTNVLDVKDFDPEQIKYELIENPEVIAKIEIEDLQVRMKDDLSSMKSQVETCKKIQSDFDTIDSYKKELKDIVDKLRPPQVFKDGKVQERKIETLLMKLDEIAKDQKDADGKLFESYGEFDWERWTQNQERFKYLSRSYRNNRLYFELPHWYEKFKSALYYINRKSKEKEIYSDPKLLMKEIDRLTFDIKKIEIEIERLNSPEFLKERTEIVIETKEKNQINAQSADQIIADFKDQFSERFSEIRIDEESKAPSLEELIAKMPVMTKDGLYATDKQTLEELETISEKMQQTEELYTDEYGNFTPERKELHERIKADIRRNVLCITPQEKPIAIITGGLPGSGKTFFLKKYAPYMNDESILKIDADSIRAKLPEYRGWNASATHKESSRLVSEILEEVGTPCVTDILYDGTMNKSKNYKPLINQLKRLGYRTFIIFLDIPLDVAKKRVLKRYAETGRYVPNYVLENSAKTDKQVYHELKSMVDGYMTVDGVTGKITEQEGAQLPHERFWFNEERYARDQVLTSYAIALKNAMFEEKWIDVKEKGGKLSDTKYKINQVIEFYDGWGKEKTGHVTSTQFNEITNEQFYWISNKYMIPEGNIKSVIELKKKE